jgi:hypothetical protein
LNYGDPKIDRLPRLSQWEKLLVEDSRDQDISAQRRGATFGSALATKIRQNRAKRFVRG